MQCLNPLKSGRPSGAHPADSAPLDRGCLNPLKSGRPSGGVTTGAFGRPPCLNPLKSGRPSGGAGHDPGGNVPEVSQSPQIGASFRREFWRHFFDEVRSVSIPSNRGVLPERNKSNMLDLERFCLNPLKSGRPSGDRGGLYAAWAAANVSIPSNRGVLPENKPMHSGGRHG